MSISPRTPSRKRRLDGQPAIFRAMPYDAVVRIGVAEAVRGDAHPDGADWTAHAWVESCGPTVGRDPRAAGMPSPGGVAPDYRVLGRDLPTG